MSESKHQAHSSTLQPHIGSENVRDSNLFIHRRERSKIKWFDKERFCQTISRSAYHIDVPALLCIIRQSQQYPTSLFSLSDPN